MLILQDLGWLLCRCGPKVSRNLAQRLLCSALLHDQGGKVWQQYEISDMKCGIIEISKRAHFFLFSMIKERRSGNKTIILSLAGIRVDCIWVAAMMIDSWTITILKLISWSGLWGRTRVWWRRPVLQILDSVFLSRAMATGFIYRSYHSQYH